jgi:hypothetical protein
MGKVTSSDESSRLSGIQRTTKPRSKPVRDSFLDAGPPSEPSGPNPDYPHTIPVFEDLRNVAEESRVRTCSMCGASLVPGSKLLHELWSLNEFRLVADLRDQR